jgi:hypothetical protein
LEVFEVNYDDNLLAALNALPETRPAKTKPFHWRFIRERDERGVLVRNVCKSAALVRGGRLLLTAWDFTGEVLKLDGMKSVYWKTGDFVLICKSAGANYFDINVKVHWWRSVELALDSSAILCPPRVAREKLIPAGVGGPLALFSIDLQLVDAIALNFNHGAVEHFD